MSTPILDTFCNRLMKFDINNLIHVRENPKVSLLFAAAGLLICVKLITLSVITPFWYLGIFFGGLLTIGVIYLIRCLANNPPAVKKALFDYGKIGSEKKSLSGIFPTLFTAFFKSFGT